MPMARIVAPAQSKHSVDSPSRAALRAVAHRRQIGKQPCVPEEERDHAVNQDGEDIPHKGRTKLRPNILYVRVRQQPVEIFRAAKMKYRIETSASQGEERHSFCKAVNGGAPLLVHQ